MLLQYGKYLSLYLIGLSSLMGIWAGGPWLPLTLFLLLSFYVFGDAFFGDDKSTPDLKHSSLLIWQLWFALPLLFVIVFSFIWSVGSQDILSIGKTLGELTGYDFLAAREQTSFLEHLAGVFLVGLMIGMVGTVTAHELTHRLHDKASRCIGRWLLAFSLDSAFSIEHVFGHHRYIGTEQDPATAKRGANVYHHIVRSTLIGNLNAWNIEKKRLEKKKLSVISLWNLNIRGYLMSLLLIVVAYLISGFTGVWVFLACGVVAKALLEVVNYMEHYGIVRDPRSPVLPRHSWNTNRRISSWSMFNLTRHSHHHAQANLPYYKLQPMHDSPMMINGYLTTMLIALFPPLWHRLMTPKVLEWDEKYASDQERQIAKLHNERSGLSMLSNGYGREG